MYPGRGTRKYSTSLIQNVLAYLGDPQSKLSVIHVTGTNGKGSVSATVGSILAQTGAKVGLTISPHLERLEERIVVDGVPIATHAFEEAAGLVAACEEDQGIEISMHEAMTACALRVFETEAVDWAVVEVGMGGLRDSTNVFDHPKVVVLTSISLDHTKTLGDSVRAIAADKLGIVKRGTTLVVGKVPAELEAFIEETAREKGAQCLLFGRDFKAHPTGDGAFLFEYRGKPMGEIRPSLRGAHQFSNMSVAAAVANHLGISFDSIKKGVEEVFWPARLELVQRESRDIWFDCAHNADGISKLVEFVVSEGLAPVDLVFGVLEDKSWREMCDALLPIVRTWKLLAPETQRALSSNGIAEYLSGIGVSRIEVFSSADELVERIGEAGDRPLLITGSMYMVGRVRSRIVPHLRPIWDVTNRGMDSKTLRGSGAGGACAGL